MNLQIFRVYTFEKFCRIPKLVTYPRPPSQKTQSFDPKNRCNKNSYAQVKLKLVSKVKEIYNL